MNRAVFSMHRAFGAVLILLAVAWVVMTVLIQRQASADQEFYAREVVPYLHQSEQQSKAWDEATDARQHGKQTPMPLYQPRDMAPLQEWVRRMGPRNRFHTTRSNIGLAFMGAAFVWVIAAQIENASRRRKWESASRPAVAQAGLIVAPVVRNGAVFIAKSPRGHEVHVDGRRAVVTFYRFQFVRSFLRNPVCASLEMPFTDLIAGSLYYDKGRAFFRLRTTAGRVMISDKVQPFEPLVNLLTDAAELNRTSPDQYRAALAREPVVKTPWWGWLIIVAAIAAVVVAFRVFVWD